MKCVRLLLTVIAAVAWCAAESTGIGGIVINRSGIPIEGVTVTLNPTGITATTKANGRFSFTTETITNYRHNMSPTYQQLNPAVTDGKLYMNISISSMLKITAFDIGGRFVKSIKKKVGTGRCSIALPCKGKGIHIYKVNVGKKEFLVHGIALGKNRTISRVRFRENTAIPLSQKSMASADSTYQYLIEVKKDGFINREVIIDGNANRGDLRIVHIESEGTVTDTDGNKYQTVRIGSQVWTVENLRTTRYNDGEMIPLVPDTAKWGNHDIYGRVGGNGDPKPQYCFYNNTTDPDTIRKFGALYNWWAVNTKKLAPKGWHVPDTADWFALRDYLLQNPFKTEATTEFKLVVKSMAAGTVWLSSDEKDKIGNDFTANNLSGFNAIPAGYRTGSSMILYILAGERAYWWTSTEKHPDVPCFFTLYDFLGSRNYLAVHSADFGLSVRLIKD